MEVESSLVNRCFKRPETIRTEYPNHKKSFADNFNKFLAGEMLCKVDESDDKSEEDVLTRKVEEIVQRQLSNYHNKVIQEMKNFHADMVESQLVQQNQARRC